MKKALPSCGSAEKTHTLASRGPDGAQVHRSRKTRRKSFSSRAGIEPPSHHCHGILARCAGASANIPDLVQSLHGLNALVVDVSRTRVSHKLGTTVSFFFRLSCFVPHSPPGCQAHEKKDAFVRPYILNHPESQVRRLIMAKIVHHGLGRKNRSQRAGGWPGRQETVVTKGGPRCDDIFISKCCARSANADG